MPDRLDLQKRLIAREFNRIYSLRPGEYGSPTVYEAPAAAAWVVLTRGECWVAQCGDGSESEDFVFYGPLGKPAIKFALPEGWPA